MKVIAWSVELRLHGLKSDGERSKLGNDLSFLS